MVFALFKCLDSTEFRFQGRKQGELRSEGQAGPDYEDFIH